MSDPQDLVTAHVVQTPSLCTSCGAEMGVAFDADTHAYCSIRCAVHAGASIDGADHGEIFASFAEEITALFGAVSTDRIVQVETAILLRWFLLGGDAGDQALYAAIGRWIDGDVV